MRLRSFRCLAGIAVLLCLTSVCSIAQSLHQLTGHVKDSAGMSLEYVVVSLQGGKYVATTDVNGYFEIRNIPQGHYRLSASRIGYALHEVEISVNKKNEALNLVLIEKDNELQVVEVSVKSEVAEIKEAGYSVNVIDVRPLQTRNLDVNQVLNASTGIRVREDGGLGSNFNLSLNGLQGNQVKMFIDGIPMENFGYSFGLNNVPVNLIERVEVYKGVVPVSLGSDALGGAINVITNQRKQKFLNASYSYGSFNTHRAAFTGKNRIDKSGFTIRANAFFNYSNNNYTMHDMEVVEKNNQILHRDVKRFHDHYSSRMMGMEAGFTDVSWADKLMIGYRYAATNTDVQTGVYPYPVAGEVTWKEHNHQLTFNFENTSITKNLGVRLYGLYNISDNISIDTSSNYYSWSGKIIGVNSKGFGEFVQKQIGIFNQKDFLTQLGIDYALHTNHTLHLNFLTSKVWRQGRNDYAVYGSETFIKPNTVQKSILGISEQSTFLHGRLHIIAQLKYYNINILTRDAKQYKFGEFTIEDVKTNVDSWGAGGAATFHLTQTWTLKSSYERTYRTPEPIEIFGNGITIIASPYLQPEYSNNVNFGMLKKIKQRYHVITWETNGFFRVVHNLIYPKTGTKFLMYTNYQDVLIRGFDTEFRFVSKKNWNASANFTYQQVLDDQEYYPNTSIKSAVYHEQLPNTPKFFANADFSYIIPQAIRHQSDVTFFYSTNFVEKFSLIPTQWLHNVGVSFSALKKIVQMTLECRNVTNALAYDNFKMQKPTRSFNVKLTYSL